MNSHTTANHAAAPPMTLRAYLLIQVRILLFVAITGALLFGSAGRWDLLVVWVYVGVFLLMGTLGAALVWKRDPTLLQERLRPGPGGKDPHLRRIGIALLFAHWVVAGLDIGRFHWSDMVPAAVQGAALAGLLAAFSLTCWAMSVNRFFSSDARIQRDRGHYVITTGPYRFIRHPGYAASITMTIASPLALGSYAAVLVILPFIAFIFRRLFREERLLLAELEGYAEYASRVHYRLVPGVW